VAVKENNDLVVSGNRVSCVSRIRFPARKEAKERQGQGGEQASPVLYGSTTPSAASC